MGTVRFLLALCVVVAHSRGGALFDVTLFSGITAVQCFYVISGFLITMVLNERPEYRSISTFYISRYLRLWPAYIVVAIATLIFFRWDAMVHQLPELLGGPELAFVALSNLTLFFQDWFLFIRFDGGHLVPTAAFSAWPGPQVNSFLLVPQCWTLGVELTFYAIAPFVCRRWWSVLVLFCFGTAVRLYLGTLQLSPADPWLYRFAPAEMVMFGAGGLAYFAGRFVCPLFPVASKAICILAVLTFAAVVFAAEPLTAFLQRHILEITPRLLIYYWPVPLLMVITVAPLFYGSRDSRIDQLLGELSYPMYVSHILVHYLIERHASTSLHAGNIFYVVSVIAASWLLIVLVITPVDRFRRRIGRREQASLTSSPASAVILGG